MSEIALGLGMWRPLRGVAAGLLLGGLSVGADGPPGGPATAPAPVAAASPAPLAKPSVMNLSQCEEFALQNNHRRPASRAAVLMAEAQHQQALAAYWPQVSLKAAMRQMDEPPNFVFPASSFAIPPQTLALNIPGMPPITIPVPAQQFKVPAQNVKLMDETTYTSMVQAQWLLYDGGMRAGMRRQAQAGVSAAEEDLRRTDLELLDSVRRLYYGAVLAGQILQVGRDTLARMDMTLKLTETMYKEGSGKVKKTDYLDNKVMVETLRSAVVLLEKNETMAQAALAYTVGLDWDQSISPADTEIPFTPGTAELRSLVGCAYQFNPDWKQLDAGLEAAEGALTQARSGHYPKVALSGELHRWWNESDSGMATADNKEGWSVGIGMEVPIFDGFLTRNRVSEARARINRLHEQQFLLKEGIGLQIRDLFLGMTAARLQFDATREAMQAATENRDLTTRAYQNELVETEKVIRAQITEAFMLVQHDKIRYDHAELQSRLNLAVGTELSKQLQLNAP